VASQTYLDFIAAVCDYLKSTGSNGPTNGKSNKQIVQAIKDRIEAGELDISLGDGSMLSYLSTAANQDPTSKIVSGGVGVGYWLEEDISSAVESKPIDEKKVSSGKGKSTVIREKHLYPLMELWLNQKGYAAKDTSNLKSGGRWGNPDIIGVERVDLFGAVEIDIASCEIKLGEEGWEQVIFEAISHKRFANRSWFCYRTPAEGWPLPKGMEYYAERYRVGLVQIILSDQEVIELKSGEKGPLDFIERVVERVPALYDRVPLREQKDVVERSGITLTMTF
jgi:hypothetical protein